MRILRGAARSRALRREGVDGLVHAVGGNVGEAEVAPDLVLALERSGEVERGSVRLDGIDGAAEPHEAPAEAAEGNGGGGVGLVDCGGSIGDAGVAGVTKALVGGAECHVGLVGRRVVGVLDGCREGADRFLRPPGGKKRYSTDGNIAGLSHEAEDLESMQTAMTIVETTMGVWPMTAPDAIESVSFTFEKGRAVAVNGKAMEPFDLLVEANRIGGRNGIGLSHALENRIIGTKSRGVYEAPGMELLGRCLRYIYQAILDRRATGLFEEMSRFIANQIYDGRYYDLATQAAFAAVETFAQHASGTVQVGLYKGNIFFQSLTDVKASLYFEENASMEDAQKGLNPVSSQGFAEIQSVEARSMAKAGQIR